MIPASNCKSTFAFITSEYTFVLLFYLHFSILIHVGVAISTGSYALQPLEIWRMIRILTNLSVLLD